MKATRNVWGFRVALLVLVQAFPFVLHATGYLGNADTAIYNLLWKVVNFVAGITGIMLLVRILWALQNTEDRGAQLKTACWNMLVLGCVWALGSWWLGNASSAGTSLTGVDTVMQLHQ
jgi:hypothetical protein